MALLLWVAGNVLAPLCSAYVFSSNHVAISYRTLLRIHCRRLPAKYLPGGIWHSVGRANDYLGMGHGGSRLGLFFLLENILLVTVTLGMSAFIIADLFGPPLLRTLVAFISPLALVLLLGFPYVLRMLRPDAEALVLGDYFSAALLLFGYWCLLGICFVCYLSAFEALPLQSGTVEAGAVYIFSWCLGYLALFAPQGIGVVEFISGNLLAPAAQTGTLLAFLVGFRLVGLAGDLFCWAASHWLGSAR